MLDRDSQPSFLRSRSSNCACVCSWGATRKREGLFLQITQSTFTFTPPILQITQSTFSSGSSRHGNAHRAPVDWNWVNLDKWKQYKTVQQTIRWKKGERLMKKYQQYLSLPSLQGTLQQQKFKLKSSFFSLEPPCKGHNLGSDPLVQCSPRR